MVERKKKILFNGTPLKSPEAGGIPRYSRFMYDGLKEEKIFDVKSVNCWKINASSKCVLAFLQPINLLLMLLWEQIFVPALLLLGNYDLYYSPTGTGIPILTRKKIVSTIHDLTPFILGQEYFSGVGRLQLKITRWRMKNAVLRSRKRFLAKSCG